MKRIMMIAGCNGSGKTTMANALISQQKDIYNEFLNADHIARGLAPLHPSSADWQAGRLMIERLVVYINSNKSFAFEATGAGRNYKKHLIKAKEKGYAIDLVFLWLSSPDQAVKRVAERVKQGGHNILESDIRRRYYRGLKNLIEIYLPLADTALVFDNSLAESNNKQIIVQKNIPEQLMILDQEKWAEMKRLVDGKS